ncbi:MAG: MerR family DNA-binding transcriptional regulator [Pseudomonadota bacterium]
MTDDEASGAPAHGWIARTHADADARTPSQEAERVYTISEIADAFDLTPRAVRFYESKGLIQPDREGQNRLYSYRQRSRIAIILRGKNLGFTLEDIAEYLQLYDADPAQITQTRHLKAKVGALRQDLERKRADLDRTLAELHDIDEACDAHLRAHGGDDEDGRGSA